MLDRDRDLRRALSSGQEGQRDRPARRNEWRRREFAGIDFRDRLFGLADYVACIGTKMEKN